MAGAPAAVRAVLGLPACVNRSQKFATDLVGYGLDARQAQCVGDRLESNLSIRQLRQLSRAAKAANRGDGTPGPLTVSSLIRVSTKIEDPRILLEVNPAALGCDVLSAGAMR